MPAIRSTSKRSSSSNSTGSRAEVDQLVERVAEIAAALRRHDDARLGFGGRAGPVLGRPQGGFPGHGPDFARLLLHGRHHSARHVAARSPAHARDVAAIRPAGRQCLSCRRRQSASAHPLRREPAGRTGARRGFRRRHSQALRRGRRRPDRRARRRGGKARPDAGDVLRRSISISSSGSNARSTARACSIPARCFRPCTAVPSLAACMSAAARLPFRRHSAVLIASRPARLTLPMVETLKPNSRDDVETAVQWRARRRQAVRDRRPRLASAAIGRPAQADAMLDLSGLAGVILYEPEELVLSAQAGTPLADIEALLASERPGPRIRADGLRPAARERKRAAAPSAAWSPPTCPGRGASAPGAARDHLLASWRCRAAARRSVRAAAWSRTSPATICASCWPAPGARSAS